MANGFFSGAQGTAAFRGWRARLAPSSCSAQPQDGVFGVIKAAWEPWWCQENNVALLFPILVQVDSGVLTCSTHRSDAGNRGHPSQSQLLILGALPVIHRESASPHCPDPQHWDLPACATQPNKSPLPAGASSLCTANSRWEWLGRAALPALPAPLCICNNLQPQICMVMSYFYPESSARSAQSSACAGVRDQPAPGHAGDTQGLETGRPQNCCRSPGNHGTDPTGMQRFQGTAPSGLGDDPSSASSTFLLPPAPPSFPAGSRS